MTKDFRDMATLEEKARAAAHFAGTVRAKRETLQTLYYAAKNSWDEARAMRQRYAALPPLDPYKLPIDGQRDLGHSALLDGAIAAEATAQDSASAFMVICDYSLQRLGTEAAVVDTRTIGADAYNGVKLNQAIWALANQARHLHKWQQNNWHQEPYDVLVALELFPTYSDSARLFLEKLQLASYIDFEERLTATALDILKGTGFELTRMGPGIVTLTMMAQPSSP
jgi:hypothetical protein